jgi:hypothetical protein
VRGIFPGLMPPLFAVNVDRGGCLGTAGSAALHVRCDDGMADRWKTVLVAVINADARFSVQNAASGRCLTAAGRTVVQGDCDDAPARQWRFRDAPGAGDYVESVTGGQCLGLGGVRAVLTRCTPAGSARWSFRERPNGPGVLRVSNGRP